MNVIESAVQLPARIGAWWEKQDTQALPVQVRERMRESFDFFRTNGFPHAKMEEWKYTDVRRITDFPYAWPVKGEQKLDQAGFNALPLADLPDAYKLVFVNGYLDEGLSVLPSGGNIFTVTHLGDADAAGEHLLRATLASEGQQHELAAEDSLFYFENAPTRVAEKPTEEGTSDE